MKGVRRLNSRVLSWLTGVISEPVFTLQEVSREKPVGWALVIYLAAIFLVLLSFGISPALVMFMWPLLFIGGFIVLGVLYHLAATLLGGSGPFAGGLSALGFSAFLFFLIPPLQFLASAAGPPGRIFAFLAYMFVFLWIMVLYVIGVKENYRLPVGRSIVVVLTPLFLAGVAAVLMFLLVVVFTVLLVMLI